MSGDVGHTVGLKKPRPWRGRCGAGYSNTGGPSLPQKRAPCQKTLIEAESVNFFFDPIKSATVSKCDK